MHVLVNPTARSAASDREKVGDQLRRLGHSPVILEPASVAQIAPLIRKHLAAIKRLIVVGGDGLIHHALPAVAQTEIPIGIVPSGTGNDFARALGLPKRRKQAVEVAAQADPQPVDLIKVDLAAGPGRWVATVLTAGFSGRVNQTANELKFPPGQQKYTVATLIEAKRLKAFDLGIVINGKQLSRRCSFFAVGNTSHFGGGMAICPTANPFDSRLDLTLVGEVSRLALLRMLPTVFAGRHVRHKDVLQLTGGSATLTLDELLWADGELLGSGPADLVVVPRSLQVAGAVCPPSAAGA